MSISTLTSRPRINIAVAEYDIARGADVPSAKHPRGDVQIRCHSILLLTVLTELSEVPRVWVEHVFLAVTTEGHDHFIASLNIPASVAEVVTA